MKRSIFILMVMTAIASCEVSVNTSKSTEKGDIKDSTYVEYYSSGKKKYQVQIIDGQKNGEEIYFYENGKMQQKVIYKNDTVNGNAIWWWENGNKKQESNWKNGKENGEVTFWYENGNLEQRYFTKEGLPEDTIRFYYPNGRLRILGKWVDGKKEGEWKYYDSLGVHYETRIKNNDTTIKTMKIVSTNATQADPR
jgi:uncharacterized protein